MPTLWMGVRPGPNLTRLLVQDGPVPILKARLPEAPQHPRALRTLAEGVALWYGRPLYAALCVAAETLSASHHFGMRRWTAWSAPRSLRSTSSLGDRARPAPAPGSTASATSLTAARCSS